jgi:hypothetical protein
MMRRITLLAAATTAAVALMVPSALAQSEVPTQLFDASVSPAVVSKNKNKPTNLSLKVRPYFDFNQIATIFDKGGEFATAAAKVRFDKNAVFNGKSFPKCTESQVFNGGGKANCPRGALVGKGKATAYAAAVKVTESVSVEIWNGPIPAGAVGSVMLKIKNIDGPVDVNTVLIGTLKKVSGDPKYGFELTVNVPENIQKPAPGVFAVVTDFDTTVKVKPIKKGKKTIPYISIKGCNTGNVLNFAYTGSFTGTDPVTNQPINTTQTVEKTQACKK